MIVDLTTFNRCIADYVKDKEGGRLVEQRPYKLVNIQIGYVEYLIDDLKKYVKAHKKEILDKDPSKLLCIIKTPNKKEYNFDLNNLP